jgi:hypothetical protein
MLPNREPQQMKYHYLNSPTIAVCVTTPDSSHRLLESRDDVETKN